jgi:hypothetical protein
MHQSLGLLIPLLVGIAGWYYLFYSRAAHRLATVEADAANARRVRLRRLNGAVMLVLAALIYIGTRGIDAQQHPRAFLAVWSCVICLLLAVVALALVDVRLTMKLRVSHRS